MEYDLSKKFSTFKKNNIGFENSAYFFLLLILSFPAGLQVRNLIEGVDYNDGILLWGLLFSITFLLRCLLANILEKYYYDYDELDREFLENDIVRISDYLSIFLKVDKFTKIFAFLSVFVSMVLIYKNRVVILNSLYELISIEYLLIVNTFILLLILFKKNK